MIGNTRKIIVYYLTLFHWIQLELSATVLKQLTGPINVNNESLEARESLEWEEFRPDV